MSISDKISANLTNAGRTVSQSFRNFNDSNALQKQIASEKQLIKQAFSDIGQLYFERFKNDPTADFYEQIKLIANAQQHIAELENSIAEVRDRKPDLVQVPVTPKAAAPSAMVCMQCGCTYKTDQTFCSSCGQRLTPQYPSAASAAAAAAQAAPAPTPAPAPAPAGVSLAKPAEPAEPAPKPAGRFCTSCGAPAAQDSAYCALCGNKL